MKRIIKKLILVTAVSATLSGFYGCGKEHKEGDGHDHGSATEKKAGEHGAETTVTLTDEQIKTVGVVIGFIEQKQLSATMKANGTLRVPNNNKANATSLFGGIIKTLNVEIGDYVKKGQVIATISNPEFIQLQEEYLTIGSRIEFAEHEVARQNELNQGNAGAKKNLQSATSELKTLKTRRSSLKQQIQLMGINPSSLSNSNLKSSLVVTSPISGNVSNVFAKIGSYTDVSSPIAELVENSALHLDLQVFEKDVPLIKVGQRIDFVVTNNPNKTYTAEVFNIGSSFNGESKTIAVHSKVIGDKTGLIDGMNITGLVDLNGVLSPAVPNEAIVNTDGKYYIFIVKEKEEKVHEHKEGDGHEHEHDHGTETKGTVFEKVEILKGSSQLGYTAIKPLNEIPHEAHVVVKGAFFVNAKLSNTGDGHAH